MKTDYTLTEIKYEIEILKNTFSTVRLVNPVENFEYTITNDDLIMTPSEYTCHAIWQKGDKCNNCISLKTLQDKKNYTKFEFVNSEIYFVLAKYIKIDNLEVILELVTKIDNSTLIDAKGNNEFVDRITKYNTTLYTDELTGVYNRKYLNSKLPFLLNESKNQNIGVGIALIDLDYFKSINDTKGHVFGDKVLCTLSNFLQRSISPRKGDFVTRFGGDEFLIVLNNIDYDVYTKRLNDILKESENLTIRGDDSNLKIGLSIGGAYSNEILDPKVESMVLLADERLYMSKQNGRNQVSY